MSIKLVTGIPGAGKSLCLVDEACKLRDSEPDRPIYAVGVEGLRADVASVLDTPERWQDLPDGSIVLVDEAWRWFPTHGPTKQPPEWVRALAEHRHRGFDFLIATQHPTQISIFVRHLCSPHVHLVRKFGTQMVQRIEWQSVQTDVKSPSSVKLAQVKPWRFPKERFALYHSATMHTVKRRVPKRVYVAGGLLLLLPVLGWAAWHSLAGLSHEGSSVHVPASSASVTAPPVGRDRPQSPAQWANARLPRVAGVPWSAPMWDKLKTTTVPDLMCVEVDQGSYTTCSCYTEQVTPLPNVPDGVCRQAAEHGVYNPYRPRPEQERRAAGRAAPADRAAPRRSVAVAADSGAVAPVGLPGPPHASGIPREYVPPEWSTGPAGSAAVSDYMQSLSSAH